jgi:hypothetical protein
MGMEAGLFQFDGWDGEIECMTFYDAVLKADIGPHKIGERFDSAVIINEGDKDYAILQLIEFGPFDEKLGCQPLIIRYECELHYRLGDEIKKTS